MVQNLTILSTKLALKNNKRKKATTLFKSTRLNNVELDRMPLPLGSDITSESTLSRRETFSSRMYTGLRGRGRGGGGGPSIPFIPLIILKNIGPYP